MRDVKKGTAVLRSPFDDQKTPELQKADLRCAKK